MKDYTEGVRSVGAFMLAGGGILVGLGCTKDDVVFFGGMFLMVLGYGLNQFIKEVKSSIEIKGDLT